MYVFLVIYYINYYCRKTYIQNLLKCLYEVVHMLSLTHLMINKFFDLLFFSTFFCTVPAPVLGQ